jgi:hypothetical protein
MKIITALLIAPLSGLTLTGQIAPASSQYQQEGAAPIFTAPVPAAPVGPVMFSRKIWPSVELADGRVLNRVRVSAEDATTVTLIHTGGIVKVDKRALPEELAKLHPYGVNASQPFGRPRTVAIGTPVTAQPQAQSSSTSSTLTTFRPDLNAPITQRTQAAVPTIPSAAAIEAVVDKRVRKYFETEKRVGSGQTLSFDVITDLTEPREVTGWSNRWEVKGTAGYKVYDSVGWGSFSTRKAKFTALVEAPPGRRITVLEFTEN